MHLFVFDVYGFTGCYMARLEWIFETHLMTMQWIVRKQGISSYKLLFFSDSSSGERALDQFSGLGQFCSYSCSSSGKRFSRI